MPKYDVTVTLGMLYDMMDIETAMQTLREAQERCDREGLERDYLEFSIDYGYYNDASAKVTITARRLETDEEQTIRERDEAHKQERHFRNVAEGLTKEQKQRLYNKLKKEFER